MALVTPLYLLLKVFFFYTPPPPPAPPLTHPASPSLLDLSLLSTELAIGYFLFIGNLLPLFYLSNGIFFVEFFRLFFVCIKLLRTGSPPLCPSLYLLPAAS